MFLPGCTVPLLDSTPRSSVYPTGTQYSVGYISFMLPPTCHCLVAKSCLTFCNPPRLLCPCNSQARILEWAAIYFSRGSSHPRDRTPTLAGRFFTTEPLGKPPPRAGTKIPKVLSPLLCLPLHPTILLGGPDTQMVALLGRSPELTSASPVASSSQRQLTTLIPSPTPYHKRQMGNKSSPKPPNPYKG